LDYKCPLPKYVFNNALYLGCIRKSEKYSLLLTRVVKAEQGLHLSALLELVAYQQYATFRFEARRQLCVLRESMSIVIYAAVCFWFT
jgi:hypothetical protein